MSLFDRSDWTARTTLALTARYGLLHPLDFAALPPMLIFENQISQLPCIRKNLPHRNRIILIEFFYLAEFFLKRISDAGFFCRLTHVILDSIV